MFSEQNKIWMYSVIFLLFSFLLFSCTNQESKNSIPGLIKGVKIYDYHNDFTQLFEQWKEIGINTVFVGLSLDSNKTFREMADKYGIKRFLIMPIFYNPEFLQKNPDNYAITSTGKKAIDDWVEFVCPTRDEYKNKRIQFIQDIIRRNNPDGLSIDFIRFFVFWEMVYPDTKIDNLPMTCLCNHCLEKFSYDTEIKFPEDMNVNQKDIVFNWIMSNCKEEWKKWKCSIITKMVKDIVEAAKEVKPDISINLHAVPWRKNDYNNAIQLIAGQDFSQLSEYVDFISPMCYNHMVKRPAVWIHSVVKSIQKESGKAVLPSIQVSKAYLGRNFSIEEFKKALISALKKPSKGVVFWNWKSLAASPEKVSFVKDTFSVYFSEDEQNRQNYK